ncbi:MAG: HRDC domain-containing protein, partial [Candidatus Heimdallarchaeota archaeon]|nr:HRDC domain-containing protein [Candidatus Heimdallarchaeota archaeon]
FDPLCIDLNPLKEIFENANVEKVFFDGLTDIQLLFQEFNWKTQNYFDISIAYNFIHGTNKGLDKLIAELLGFTFIKIKSIQKGNWTRRPIKKDYMNYAANDVLYLIACKDKIVQDLDTTELQILNFHFLQLSQLKRFYENDALKSLKLFKSLKLKDNIEQSISYRLINYREKIGKQKNMNPGLIVSKSQIIKLAKDQPQTPESLVKSRILNASQNEYINPINQIINQVMQKYDKINYRDTMLMHKREILNQYQGHLDMLNEQLKWEYSIDFNDFDHNYSGVVWVYKNLEDKYGRTIKFLFSKELMENIALYSSQSDFDKLFDLCSNGSIDEILEVLVAITTKLLVEYMS